MDTKRLNGMTGEVANMVLEAVQNADGVFESTDSETTHQEGLDQTGTFVDGADVTSDAFTFRLYHDIDRTVEGRRGPGSRVPVGKVVYTVTVRASYTSFDGE